MVYVVFLHVVLPFIRASTVSKQKLTLFFLHFRLIMVTISKQLFMSNFPDLKCLLSEYHIIPIPMLIVVVCTSTTVGCSSSLHSPHEEELIMCLCI